jgi:hypothetical protein
VRVERDLRAKWLGQHQHVPDHGTIGPAAPGQTEVRLQVVGRGVEGPPGGEGGSQRRAAWHLMVSMPGFGPISMAAWARASWGACITCSAE